jgi:hypothetical protein
MPPMSQNTIECERDRSTIALMSRMSAAANVLKITPTSTCV